MAEAALWGALNASEARGRGNASAGAGAGWSRAALAGPALALLLVAALSALGNGAVALAVGRRGRLRTVPNALVVALALAELLGGLLCLPAAAAALLRGLPPGAWPWGARLCPAGAALHAALGAAATLTMALLAFERYCALARQPRRPLPRRRAAQLLAAVWLAALGLAGPWYLLARPQEARPQGPAAQGALPHCWHTLPRGPSPLGAPYGAAVIVLGYLLPFALMCFCHYHICQAVRLSESRVRPLATYGPPGRVHGEVRTATTVLVMVVSIICCWGPYCLLGLAAAAGNLSVSPAADAVACWVAWADGAVNPLIYAVRNPDVAVLFGRNREGGYRTRNDLVAYLAAARGRPAPEAKSRAERYASQGHGDGGTAGSALCSSSPASGGELATWACRNPALLFCRDGQPDTLPKVGARLKSETVDTSL